MILSATNCIGTPLKAVKGTRFITRTRSDVVLRSLNGEVPATDYDLLLRNGVTVYAVRDYSELKPGVFLWSPFVDSVANFWMVDDVPISPIPPTPKSASNWIRANYKQAPKMGMTHRIAVAREIDSAISRMNPDVRKILVIYELHQLVEEAENGDRLADFVLLENAVSDVAIASVLQPLGWEIAFEPYGLKKRSPSWYHSDFGQLRDFYRSIGIL